MAHGIAMTLDGALDAQVLSVWRQFEAVGVGKTPDQFDVPPHVTLALLPSGDPARLTHLMDATPFSDLGVRLIPFGAFLADQAVLYYTAVLCPTLQRAHAELYELIHACHTPACA